MTGPGNPGLEAPSSPPEGLVRLAERVAAERRPGRCVKSLRGVAIL